VGIDKVLEVSRDLPPSDNAISIPRRDFVLVGNLAEASGMRSASHTKYKGGHSKAQAVIDAQLEAEGQTLLKAGSQG